MILGNQKFKYSKVRENILDAILAGDLAPDAILPSELELRKKLGIGRNTLRTALHELEEAGIIIKQHGRQSRINVDALRKQREPLRRIAWVDTSPIGATNPIFFGIFQAISEQAALRNVKLDYISLSIEAMADAFFPAQMRYDGLIVGEITSCFKNYLTMFHHPNCVCVECPRSGIAHCVKTDCRLGGQIAARTLLESGHRRLAFLGEIDYVAFRQRLEGFSDYLEKEGNPLTPERSIIIACPEDEDNFSEFLKRHLPILKNIDGLFVYKDYSAVSVIFGLQKLGLHVPDDLSVIGFDGLTLSQFVSPMLTTLRQPVEEIGRKALEIVLNPSERASYPEIIEFPPVLQLGDTVISRESETAVSNINKTTRKGKRK